MKLKFLYIITSFLPWFVSGLGFLFLAIPFLIKIFYEWDFFDPETGSFTSEAGKYVWLISGPYPFSHLGGGPFQIAFYGGCLLVGVLLTVIAIVLRKTLVNNLKKAEKQGNLVKSGD